MTEVLAPTPSATSSRTVRAAAFTGGLTLLALSWAYLVDSPWKSDPEANVWGIRAVDVGEVAFILGSVALGMLVIFGVVVRRAVASDAARCGRDALILALVAVVLTAPAFWTGIPIIAGCAAVLLGVEARRRGRSGAVISVAIVLGAIATVASTVFCIIG